MRKGANQVAQLTCMVSRVTCPAILLLALFTFAAQAAEFTGKVVSVTDGDTITVLEGKAQRKIRLLGIDAPEKAQAFGSRAKQALSDLVFGKTVRVVWKAHDRYERILGDVYAGDAWANRVMVERGMAWAYKPSTTRELKAVEAEARKAKRGLWRDKNPVPPWDWRKEKLGHRK
jgi:micrococcal nuclease